MRCFFLFLVGMISIAAGAQPSPLPPSSLQPSFIISGKVVDARSGQPLARCVVAIQPTTGLTTGPTTGPATQRTASLAVTTGEDGGFAFAGLAAAKYHLTASRRGYLSQAYQQHGDDLSTAIAAGPGLLSDHLVFPLTPQSIVSGTIRDEAGEPVRGAQVKLYADREHDGVRSTIARHAASSDDLGQYEVAEVPPGDYYLGVSAQPWYAHGVGQGVFHLTPGEDQEESPDSALDVAYATTFYPNATNSDEATPVAIAGGERLEMNVTLIAQHALRLRIPVPEGEGATFNAEFAQSIFGRPEAVPAGMQRERDGVLEVDGLLPGSYNVTLNQFGGTHNNGVTHFATEVAAGETTLVAAETVDDVTVTGKVSGLEGKIPGAGITLSGPHRLHSYFALLDDAGEFSMQVPPGEYEVIGKIPQMFLARVAAANAQVHGRMVAVQGGGTPVLDITASKGFGHIDGFVTAGGKRPGGVLVLLAPEDATDNEILFRRDQSDSDGSFSLHQVVPGRYRLMAIGEGFDLAWRDDGVLRAFYKKSILIEVHAGETIREVVDVQAKDADGLRPPKG